MFRTHNQREQTAHFASSDQIIYADMSDQDFIICMENKIRWEDRRSGLQKWFLRNLFSQDTDTLSVTGYEILRLIKLARLENENAYALGGRYMVKIDVFRDLANAAAAHADG